MAVELSAAANVQEPKTSCVLESGFKQLALSDPPSDQGEKEAVSFFGLPRELRDMIYDKLWQTTPRLYIPKHRKDNSSTFDLRYGGGKYMSSKDLAPYAEGLPMWLLCSKTLLNEGKEQLIRKASWHITLSHGGRKYEHRTANECSRLIGLHVSTDLTLSAICPAVPAYDSPREIGGHITYELSPTVHQPISGILPMLGSTLRSLTLKLLHSIKANPDRASTIVWNVHIPEFNDCTTCIETIQVHVSLFAIRGIDWGYNLHFLAPSLENAYEAEVQRIGERMCRNTGNNSDDYMLEKRWGPHGRRLITDRYPGQLTIRYCKRKVDSDGF
jgi:hypothetical protein